MAENSKTATFPLRLPKSIRLQAVELAKREGLSLNQFIALAVVEKIASYTILYQRWREAALDVETNGQTLTVTSTTRTGKTEKPIVNPAVKNEILYQAAMMRAAVKFGLNPLDRPRVEAPEAEDEGRPDPFERFLDQGNEDPELAYLYEK
jgi:P27 family predicted phage terminase small subunit